LSIELSGISAYLAVGRQTGSNPSQLVGNRLNWR
jgi:hypothetical protein